MPLLKSGNTCVVLAVCSLQYYCGVSSIKVRTAMSKALMRIHRDWREILYVVLRSIQTLAKECPSAFAPFLHDFFVKTLDPPFTKLIKDVSDVLSVVERPKRGRCVIASRPLPANFLLGTGNNYNNYDDAATNSRTFFPPLAIPVLNRSHRRERCTFCLGRLRDPPLVLWEHPVCPILICSSECRPHSSKSVATIRTRSFLFALFIWWV